VSLLHLESFQAISAIGILPHHLDQISGKGSVQNTLLWRDTIDPDAGRYFGGGLSAAKRAELMTAHADDAPVPVDLREFPFQSYPGLANMD
jgi:hypothetical protein